MMMDSMNNNMMNQINNNNMINPMNIMMMNPLENNMMNQKMEMMNYNNFENYYINPKKNNDEIIIHFRYQKKEENLVCTIRCSINEHFDDVIQRIKPKIKHLKDPKYVFNAKSVNSKLTLDEIGITDNSNVFIVEAKGVKGVNEEKTNEERPNEESDLSSDSNSSLQEKEVYINDINIYFSFRDGIKYCMTFKENTSVGTALHCFLNKFNINEEGIFIFIHNGRKIESNTNQTLKEYFNGSLNLFVDAINTSDTIGA